MTICPEMRLGVRGFAGLVACYLLLCSLTIQADEGADQKRDDDTRSFTLQAEGRGVGPYAGEANGKALPLTIYKSGVSTRADFKGPGGERAMMLHDADRNEGWMISLDRGIALPLQGAGAEDLMVDPAHPCAHLPERCEPGRNRFVAGRPLDGWRYRDAEAHGPGGTSDGEFWVDPDTGVVLAYRGTRRGWEQVYEMTATSIRYGQLPAELFKVPETVTLLDPDTRR